MITVIIPALNEEKNISQVVCLAKKSPHVTEVIVVDDKSMDNTIEEAKREGAIIITSTRLGKGASMKDGLSLAKNEIIVFLNADTSTYPENVIHLLTAPIINNRADFVKSCFSRQAGRVTELVAKPLLTILIPGFPSFWQPLSGMIAGKKEFFKKIEFEEGYGVDIGILIDMHLMGARIEEVSVGHVQNKMQPLEQLGIMSRAVASTIMTKSKGTAEQKLETYENIQVIREQMEYAIRESLLSLKKIVMFDMDNTIFRTSFIEAAAVAFGFAYELNTILQQDHNPYIRTKLIARLLKGRSIGDLIRLIDGIDVTPALVAAIHALKEKGYITGIISDSYDCVTNHVKNKFGFDFSIANELEFSKSVATGEVKIPSLFLSGASSQCSHEYCKLNALISICEKYGVGLKNTVVVGDSENDICCLEKAGIGVSFCSVSGSVDAAASHIIKVPDFGLLVPLLN